MSTLPTLHAAFLAAGKSKAAIARLAEITPETLRTYMTGSQIVPEHRRARLQEAFGRPIDWPQYCADYARAKNRHEGIGVEAAERPLQREVKVAPPPPPKAKVAPPAPAPRPRAPIQAPKPAPAAAPERKFTRLFGILPIYDDEASA